MQILKPQVTPIAARSPDSIPPLWTTPQTEVDIQAGAQATQPPIQWEAPLTKVTAPANSSIATETAIDVDARLLAPMKMAPMKMPATRVANLEPIHAGSSSIIRERNTDGNDFSDNSFASRSKPLAPSINPNANSRAESPPRKSFEVVSQSPADTGFQNDNSFSPQSPATTSTGSNQSTWDSGGSSASTKTFDTNPDTMATNRIEPVSFNKPEITRTLPKPKTNTAESFEAGEVLALVGGEPIFVGDLLFEINQMIEKFMPGAPEEAKAFEREKMIPQMLPKFVEAKILFLGTIQMLPEGADIEKVLEQASKEFDDKALDKMIKGSGLKSAAEFDANLRAMGSSLRQLRRSWAHEQLTKYFLSQQLNVNTDVTHQEMLDSYRDNIDEYAIPAKCRWEQVMVRFDQSSSRAAAKDAVVKLGNEIVYGANMAAVAKKNSQGFMAGNGGQHDWTTQGALVLKEIDKAIFSLPVGELSDIIESRDGYHVVRVIERTAATRKPFLEAQVEIKVAIQDEKRKQAFDEHVAKLKREIPVEYFVNDEAVDPTDGQTPRTAKR